MDSFASCVCGWSMRERHPAAEQAAVPVARLNLCRNEATARRNGERYESFVRHGWYANLTSDAWNEVQPLGPARC